MAEGETGEDGSLWAQIAFTAQPRLILALVVAPRTQAGTDELTRRTASVLVRPPPLFASDGLHRCGAGYGERGCGALRPWRRESPSGCGRYASCRSSGLP